MIQVISLDLGIRFMFKVYYFRFGGSGLGFNFKV